MTTAAREANEEIGLAGRVGFWSVIGLSAVLLVHPVGHTDLYDDGGQFLDHVDVLWVAIHFAAALLFLALLLPIGTWVRHLGNPRALVLGRWALYAAIVGTAVGVIHLTATDTTTFIAFTDTFEAGEGNEFVELGADLLLRIHAATFVAWTTSYFVVVPLGLSWAAHVDGRFPGWYPWLAALASLLAATSVTFTLLDRQLTTLSDMALLRPSVSLYLVWLVVTTWWMRKGTLVRVSDV